MEFSVSDSPAIDVTFRRYDPALFPKFRILFEPSENDNLPRFLAQPPDEAEAAVVMENHAQKDVTALRYNWVMTAVDGSVKGKNRVSSDSYMVGIYRPVLKPDDRLLISRSTSIHESILDHVLGGGGGLGIGSGSGGNSSLPDVTSIRFEVDMLLFSDGEIAGPDTSFAAELRCRKPAAEFVVKHVRAAETEHRDVTHVLSALAEVPHLHDDYLAEWTRHYASQYLSSMRDEQMRGAMLRYLENCPTLPKFYRREGDVH